MVSLYHVKMYVPKLKSNKASDYVRWWPQMDAYGVFKEFGEVMKTTKYNKLLDVEKKYEADGQTEFDLKHTEDEKEALIKNRICLTPVHIVQERHKTKDSAKRLAKEMSKDPVKAEEKMLAKTKQQ